MAEPRADLNLASKSEPGRKERIESAQRFHAADGDSEIIDWTDGHARRDSLESKGILQTSTAGNCPTFAQLRPT